jgi:hypothetical protein
VKRIGLIALVGLAGCAATVRLYPANQVAQAGGTLSATTNETDMGSGPIKVTMPGGEVLKGRYSIDPGFSTGYGNIYASAFGGSHRPFSNAFRSWASPDARSTATASLVGRNATTMKCEIENNNFTGHGDGECQTSTGAIYRIHY